MFYERVIEYCKSLSQNHLFVFKTYYILLAWFLCIVSLTGKESGELTFSFRDIKIAEKTIYQNVQYFHEMIYET